MCDIHIGFVDDTGREVLMPNPWKPVNEMSIRQRAEYRMECRMLADWVPNEVDPCVACGATFHPDSEVFEDGYIASVRQHLFPEVCLAHIGPIFPEVETSPEAERELVSA